MRKSYSKIRHIKNSNIILENRFLKEDEILDDILKKLNDSGFDSLDMYERTVLRDYKNYAEENRNLDRFVSPERDSLFMSPARTFGRFKANKLDEPYDWDVYSIHDDTTDENKYIMSFDGESFMNQNDTPVNPDMNQYEQVDCFETIEEFSKKFPILCYKSFKFFSPKLFNGNEMNKSSDFPEWWWKLQDTDDKSNVASPYRINDTIEKTNHQGKEMFNSYKKHYKAKCLQLYKKNEL